MLAPVTASTSTSMRRPLAAAALWCAVLSWP